MAVDLNALRQERAKAITEMRALNDGVMERGVETTEETEKFKKMDADIDRQTRSIEREEKLIQHEADMARTQLGAHGNGANGHDPAPSNVMRPSNLQSLQNISRMSPTDLDSRIQKTIQGWLRAKRPDGELTAEHFEAAKTLGVDLQAKEIAIPITRSIRQVQNEYRDMGVTAANGGYMIPVGFSGALERALLAFGGVRQVATVLRTTSGNDLHWPTTNDTSNVGAILNEATTIGTSVDPAFSEVIFKAFKYSSKNVLISAELLQDNFFTDLGAMIGSMLGERIARIQNTHFTTGAGSTLPKGLTVAGVSGKTGAATNTFTSDEVIDTLHSVDPAYRPNASWMFHDSVLAFIRKLKESTTNAYIWQPGLQNGVPDMLLGYRYTVNQAMSSTFGTGQKLILFGDMSKYLIRDVAEVRLLRLEERYADLDQVAFIAFLRTDGNLLDAGTRPVKWMNLA